MICVGSFANILSFLDSVVQYDYGAGSGQSTGQFERENTHLRSDRNDDELLPGSGQCSGAATVRGSFRRDRRHRSRSVCHVSMFRAMFCQWSF